LNVYSTRAHLLEDNLKIITFLSKITPKLDNLIGSECREYMMKWIGLIGLLICSSVNAQSVICERYGAFPGEPQQTFNRRCPAGYREVGQVGSSSRSGGLANTQQPLVDAITRNNQRTTEALTQSINRSRSQAVSSGQSRQQAAATAFATALSFITNEGTISKSQWNQLLDAAAGISNDFKTSLVAFDTAFGGQLGGEMIPGKAFGELLAKLPADQQSVLLLATTSLLSMMFNANAGRIGASFEEDRFISVSDITLNGPMERAGVKSGEQIISVGIGNRAVISTRDMGLEFFGGLLRSAKDQEIRLQVIPEGSRNIEAARTVRVFRERRDVNTGIWENSSSSLQTTLPATPQATERGNSLVNGLRDLTELHSQGILTDEEFNAAKRRLLGL
jgi:hypothetical protein